MMMPILAGYIAMSIGERPALMPGVVGGFLAVNGGSGFFGALSMLFNCTVPVPHGGLFVFDVVTNWPMYFVALVIGALAACFILGFTRKDAVE